MIKAIFVLLATVSATLHSSFGQGQVVVSHNASLNAFDRAIGIENTGVINGSLYKMSFFSASTNPFFSSGEVIGTVRFKGKSYAAPILYDLYQDEVVIKHISAIGNAWFVKLSKSDVDEFILEDRLFRNVNGIYHEVLFDGETFKVFARRTKYQHVKGLITSYQVHDEYYVVQDSRWSRIASPARLTSLLANKADKRKVTAFMREQRIRRKRFTGADLGKVAAFVNTLPVKISKP